MVYLIAPQAWAWRPGRVKGDAADAGAAAVHFPLRRSVFSEAWGGREIYRAPAGTDREAVADARRILRKIRAGARRPPGGAAPGKPPRRGRAPHAVPAGRRETDRKYPESAIYPGPAGGFWGRTHNFLGTGARGVHPSNRRVHVGLPGARGGGFGGERHCYHRGGAAGRTHGDLLSRKRVKLDIGALDGKRAVSVDGQPGGRTAGGGGADPARYDRRTDRGRGAAVAGRRGCAAEDESGSGRSKGPSFRASAIRWNWRRSRSSRF